MVRVLRGWNREALTFQKVPNDIGLLLQWSLQELNLYGIWFVKGEEETGQDFSFTRSGFKDARIVPETTSQFLATPSELTSEGVKSYVTASERNRLKETLRRFGEATMPGFWRRLCIQGLVLTCHNIQRSHLVHQGGLKSGNCTGHLSGSERLSLVVHPNRTSYPFGLTIAFAIRVALGKRSIWNLVCRMGGNLVKSSGKTLGKSLTIGMSSSFFSSAFMLMRCFRFSSDRSPWTLNDLSVKDIIGFNGCYWNNEWNTDRRVPAISATAGKKKQKALKYDRYNRCRKKLSRIVSPMRLECFAGH
nr:hypothetical protein [Tanacetum cinerariifolium]